MHLQPGDDFQGRVVPISTNLGAVQCLTSIFEKCRFFPQERHELRGNNAAAKAVYENLAEKLPSPMVFIQV
jgi:hypothetical protein